MSEKQSLQDNQKFDSLLDVIKQFTGSELIDKKDITKKRLSDFAISKNINSFEQLTNKIIVDRTIRQEVINLITVNETYFYREVHQLESGIYYCKKSNWQMHILCAPCSSGEEVYSLGMIAYSIGLDKSMISITGVDINSQAILKANAAEYQERALQKLTLSQKNIFFDKKDDCTYKIKKHLMPRINFKVMNVFDHNFEKMGKFDIIYSRNMLIYFNDEFRLKAIEAFWKLLNQGGRLYVGHADTVPFTDVFKKRSELGISFYEKV
ncbi:CheR family methyltransferase [Campylobacter sputorum]|uniref:CheR family methyltransferase n=1 Tax=Campylobacter sputorum TaxID=206 RepID=UPI00053BF565|nr:CheR family methyltransferase [Campylobacter sputorum]